MDSVLVTKAASGGPLRQGEIYSLEEAAAAMQLDVAYICQKLECGETVESNGVVVAPLIQGGAQPDF